MKLKHKFDGSKIFFTSDLHFGHKNIIDYCSRPYSSVQEMNEDIVKQWNSVVPEDGVVINLGDLSMHNTKAAIEGVKQLNGEIYHVVGNHDDPSTIEELKKLGIKSYDILSFDVEDEELRIQNIVACHYQFIEWDGKYKGSWHIYGHQHSLEHNNTDVKLDVGVDGHFMRPWTFQELKIQMTKQFLAELNTK